MAHNAPVFWYKEVPVQAEAFLGSQGHVVHNVSVVDHSHRPSATCQGSDGGIYTTQDQELPLSFVWRTKANATCLELIPVSCTDPQPARSVAFQFPSPIAPGVHFVPAESNKRGVCCFLITTDAVAYRINLHDIDALFHHPSNDNTRTTGARSFTVRSAPISAKQHTLVSQLRYIEEGTVALRCTDGTLSLLRSQIFLADTSAADRTCEIQDLHDSTFSLNQINQPGGFKSMFNKFQSSIVSTIVSSTTSQSGFATTGSYVLAMGAHSVGNLSYLFTLSQDRHVRVWSPHGKLCQAFHIPPSPDASGIVQETINPAQKAFIGTLYNPNMPWALRLFVYIPTSHGIQLYVYTTRLDLQDGIHFTQTSQSSVTSEALVGSDSGQFNLVSMSIQPGAQQDSYTIWGLWARDRKVFARYLHVTDPMVEASAYGEFAERNQLLVTGRWWNVAMDRELNSLLRTIAFLEDDPTRDVTSQFVEFVFKAGRFSNKTIVDSLIAMRPYYRTLLETAAAGQVQLCAVAISAMSGPEDGSLYADDAEGRQEQVKAWRKFISACAQRELEGATPAGLAVHAMGYLVIIKEESLSFLRVCDESEIVYHTFMDKQFEVSHFLGVTPSQLKTSYPHLASLGLRQNVSKVMKATEMLFCKLSPALLKTLENRMRGSLLLQTISPRQFADEIFEGLTSSSELGKEDVMRAMHVIDSCEDMNTVLSYLLDQLTYSPNNPPNPQEGLFFLPHEALVAESAQQLAAERFTMAQKLLVLMSIVYWASAGGSQDVKLVADVLQVAQSLLLLKWLVSKTISSDSSSGHGDIASAETAIEQQMAGVRVRDSSSSSSSSLDQQYAVATRQSLLLALVKPQRVHDGRSLTSHHQHHQHPLQHQLLAASVVVVEQPFYLSITRAVSRLLDQLRIVSRERTESTTTHLVGLAQRLSALGEVGLLSEFLDLVPLTSTLAYYRGKVLLRQQRPEEALKQFLPLLACFGNDVSSVEQQLDIIRMEYQQHGHVKRLAPASKMGGAASEEAARPLDYYMHLIALFQQADAHAQAVTVARAALDSLAAGKEAATGDQEHVKRTLLGHIFDSSLAVRGYHAACKAMLELSSVTAMRQSLEVLISTAVKNNDASQLCSLQFENMSDLFERRMATLARESPLLGKTNLYEVLFSHYIYKGDFRNAASIMCELASRLNITLTSGSATLLKIAPLLSEMGKAYLAAINAMYMLEETSRWVAIPATREPRLDKEGNEDVIKRRKLGFGLPSSSSSYASNAPSTRLQILKLKDLQKEYALAIAKLRLLHESPPELSTTMTTTTTTTDSLGIATLSAQAAVYMLLKLGDHESATTLSLMFELDLSPVLNFLVDHYLYLLSHEQSEMLDWDIRDIDAKKKKQANNGGNSGDEAEDGKDIDEDEDAMQDVDGAVVRRRSKGQQGGSNGRDDGSVAVHGPTLSVKALHTLREYLEKHDSAAGSNFKYRAKVIERILRQNRSFSLPPWLTQHYLKHTPEDLIRLYLRYGTIVQAASFASTVIRATIKPDELVAKHPLSRWLPYSILDEILQGLRDETARLEEKVSKEGGNAGQNSNAVAAGHGLLALGASMGGSSANAGATTTTTPERRLQDLRDSLRQLESSIDAYFENVERESVFSA
ncbi:hypothetical protein DFQ26_005082 [Actinomortierella ambigua]|nr:hypothetical protein DFQ26_005082 [Actinomortierella ambigua]